MIKSIKLKFGSKTVKSELEVEVAPVTIIVGPNNVGKSKLLREIEMKAGRYNSLENFEILSDIDYCPVENPDQELQKLFIPEPLNTGGLPSFGNHKTSVRIEKSKFLDILRNANQRKMEYSNYVVKLNLLFIDGISRLSLINPQPASDLQTLATTNFGILFKDNDKRYEVRRIIKEAFKKYFVIDPTAMGSLRIRLSNREPAYINEEKGLDNDAVEFHKKALDIVYTSDGIKAFTGIVIALVAEDSKVVFIDEPEAFLHPALATTLAKEMSAIAKRDLKNLIIATHSANILMGCIQSRVPINVIRLTYSSDVSTVRLLSNDKIIRMMRNPLLRSTGVLNGLFYDYVIVTEGDSDRAFYQEVNERLLQIGRGISNCLFLNAQNKQTIHDIIRPLREMGIPTAGIVDIDIIKEGGSVWTNFLTAANISGPTINSTSHLRTVIKNKFEDKGDYKKLGGIELLDVSDKNSANDLFDQLDSYGLFTVRKGELESWLKELNINGYKKEWLIKVFEKMGEDPLSPEYLKPSTGDVWDFIEHVKIWFENSSRKGMPE
jgi:predicted ATPase